jgi:hypothetical protein
MTEEVKEPTQSFIIDAHLKHVSTIGEILVETVNLEVELARLFSRMLSISPRVGRAIMLAPKGQQVRLDILKHAAEAAFLPSDRTDPESELAKQKAEALKKILHIVKKSQDAMDKRHRIVHDQWEAVEGDPEVKRRVVNGKTTRETKVVPIQELRDQLTLIQTTIDDAIELAAYFKESPPTRAKRQSNTTNESAP